MRSPSVCLSCEDDPQIEDATPLPPPVLKRGADGMFKCSHCDYKAKKKSTLTRHLADSHEVGVQWFECNQPGCDYKAKQKSNLTQHLAYSHDVGVQWFECNQPGCDYKAKDKGTLTQHLADRHDIGVQWFECNQPGCDYKAKQKGTLTQHLAYSHDIGVQWFECNQQGCDYKAKKKSHLTQHLADRHDIGVQWFECNQPGCDYKAKKKGTLTQHFADRHDVGVRWFECNQQGCDYKAKKKSNLTQHLAVRHFDVYCQRKKEQEENVRKALLAAGWLEWSSSDTLPPEGHFKREHKIDFKCAQASADRRYCRIDFVLSYAGGSYVFLEVDEHQHRFGYVGTDGAGISCDSKRMANVQTSITLEFVDVGAAPPPVYWLRYNPHEWHVDGVLRRVPKVEREARLCAFLKDLEPKTGIGYAFYDYDEVTGLDVLAADEFPDAFRDLVENLEDFVARTTTE